MKNRKNRKHEQASLTATRLPDLKVAYREIGEDRFTIFHPASLAIA